MFATHSTTTRSTTTHSTTTRSTITHSTTARSTATRRHDSSLVGQLNVEWEHLADDPSTAEAVARWAEDEPALAGAVTLTDVERAASAGARSDADAILLTLLRVGQRGEALALRTVFQLMLGKAIKIAASHAGRDARPVLEQAAVTALWTTVATYPVDRRPTKVAANLAMDTLRLTVAELAHQRHETPSIPSDLPLADDATHEPPADLELLNLLAWAVDHHVVSRQDATLLMDIYAPAPGCEGGPAAAARHGLTWAAARQRASRATRKISRAVRADHAAALAA